MEHLPYPKDPVFDRRRVPYVCTERYDGLDFLTYPARAGWPQILPSSQYPDFRRYDEIYPSDDRELEKFFQSWVFFGLLHELFAGHGLYNEDDYLEMENGIEYVHTRRLIPRLREWQFIVSQWDQSTKSQLYDRLEKCLRLAQNAISILSQYPKSDVLIADKNHLDFNKAIKHSLPALCETIVCAIEVALLEKQEDSYSPVNWKTIGWDLNVEQRMRQEGWCPSQIASVAMNFNTFAGKNYVSAMRIGRPGLEHAECTADVCEELQIKSGEYATAHRCQDGDCELLGPNMEDILRIVEQRKIPILRIRENSHGGIEIKVVPHEQGLPYVAVSHVWSDGLGNETGNELPRCQLLHLRSLLRRLCGHELWDKLLPDQTVLGLLRAILSWNVNTRENRELHLWCDTLCCPVVNSPDEVMRRRQKEARKFAVTSMREVYSTAAYVLVLDSMVQMTSYSESGPIECAMKLLTSNWIQRMWTFQEAVLPKHLLIQFADQAIDIRALWVDAKAMSDSDITYHAILMDIMMRFRTIRIYFNMTSGGTIPDFANVAAVLRLRRVSKQADEPLCLASLLGLDTRQIVDSMQDDAETRMCRFWHALPTARYGIPADIVFNTMRRLHTTGYRWAPASIQESVFSSPDLETRWGDALRRPSTLTRNGLMVKLSAWRICLETPHPDIPSELRPGHIFMEDGVHLRHPDGGWSWLLRRKTDEYPIREQPDKTLSGEALGVLKTAIWDLLTDAQKTVYVLFDSDGRGLVGSLEEAEDGTKYIRSLMIALASSVSSNEAILRQAAYQCSTSLREEQFQPPISEQQVGQRVHQVAQEALEQNPQLAALVQNSSVGDAAMYLGSYVYTMMAGMTAAVVETFGPETEWCID